MMAWILSIVPSCPEIAWFRLRREPPLIYRQEIESQTGDIKCQELIINPIRLMLPGLCKQTDAWESIRLERVADT